MPLSIGLFGAWGSGKSYFMDLIAEQLHILTQAPGKVFHQKIVQIRFNAWHYLDTNLWANLVCEIFDQLFINLDERPDATDAQVKKLKNELAQQSALAAEAKEALVTAEAARVEAEKALREAVRDRQAQEKAVGALLDDLTSLVVDPKVKNELRAAADGLGLPKLQTSFAVLEARADEVRSLAGRFRAIALAVLTGPGWWMRSMLLAAALAAPLLIAALAQQSGYVASLLKGAGQTIAQVVAAVTALSAWLSWQVKSGGALVTRLEDAYDRVRKVRADRESKDDAALAQASLAAKRQAEEQARHTLHVAEEKMKSIRAELAELAPGRQLIRFLKERASAEDYRQHLGLVSLVRRDFEQLSRLLMKAGEENDQSLPRIDRIVLYIDDLDRCRTDRVIEVLEAVHLLLAFPLFAVIVAVDPRWLRQSLLDHYPRLLGGSEETASSQSHKAARPATPQDYLEKVFQVPFNLQQMDKAGFELLVKRLLPFAEPTGGEVSAPSAHQAPRALESPTSSPPADPSTPPPALPKPDPAPTSPTAQPAVTPVATSERKASPPDPERLVLTAKEVADVQRFQPLFQTPRAVKRLANTYCLVRVGVSEKDWLDYLGTGDAPGEYRTPLIMLAVASAFPALARPWLSWLYHNPKAKWLMETGDIASLATMNADTTDPVDWERLKQALSRTSLEGWAGPDTSPVLKWIPRVARYSFG